jgi:hypothetical protein
VLDELLHRVTPVRSTLKSVDGLGAVDSRKRPDFWGQILTLHTGRVTDPSPSEMDSIFQGKWRLGCDPREASMKQPREVQA